MNLLDKFYSSFMQEIVSRQLANEDGETQEQAFTRYVLDLLSEAGETENAAVAFDEKALGTSKQHKINGFAISDNYETIDLFISLYAFRNFIVHDFRYMTEDKNIVSDVNYLFEQYILYLLLGYKHMDI